MACAVDRLVHFAVYREVQRFKLKIVNPYDHTFPELGTFPSSLGGHPAFYHLKDLRLAFVNVKDEFIKYILESCPSLEELHIQNSKTTKDTKVVDPSSLRVLDIECCNQLQNIKVVDPPSLRVLKIGSCIELQSLEISNLVSLMLWRIKNILVLKGVLNLRELCIESAICIFFLSQPKLHSSYSAHLEKLILYFRPMKRVKMHNLIVVHIVHLNLFICN